MLSQITYQDKATQTEPDKDEKIYSAIAMLCAKIEDMNKDIQQLKSQQHDYKNAELSRSEDSKNPELEGDVGKHQKTQANNLKYTAAGSSGSTSYTRTSTKTEKRYVSTNMNKIFERPYTPKPQHQIFTPPQINTYRESLNQDKKAYNHITRSYIENIHKIQTFLNKNPRSRSTQNPNEDYITQNLQGYNKLLALPKTNANLVATCYNYGLLHTVYTQTGDEIATIPELHKAFLIYKKITKGTLFYIRIYSAPAEILYEEIKPIIQVIKIGLTKDMLIPREIEEQAEIPKIEIPAFYAGKRVIGIATILNELTTNYVDKNPIWSYYSREQTMIYSPCRELKTTDMEEIRQWAMSLLNPEQQPITRAIRKNFISEEIMTRYCKIIGHRYPDHQCSKCQGEDNVIPDVQLE